MTLSTKRSIRTAVRALVQDTLHHKWSDTAVDAIIALSMDYCFVQMLSANPWHSSTERVITSANFNLSTAIPSIWLDNSTTPITERFYKLQKVMRANQQYEYVDPQDVTYQPTSGAPTTSTVQTFPNFSYTVMRNKLYLFPVDATTEVFLLYSYLPDKFTSMLDADTLSAQLWPEGSEQAIIYHAAAQLELDPTRSVKWETYYQRAMDMVLTRIKRVGGGPAVMATTDDTIMWGD